MAEQDPATSTVRPNVWVFFVLQFLASETAMIGRQYQISPECNRNLRSSNQKEIFYFYFLSDRDMGNCNLGWSIRSHPSLYELSRTFFDSISIGIDKFWSWWKWKHRRHLTVQICFRRWNRKHKNWRKRSLQSTRAAVLIVQRSSWREWYVYTTFCNVFYGYTLSWPL